MTSQKLYGILTYLDSLDTKVNLQSALEAVRDALNQLVSAPAQPQHQNNLATALANLDAAAEKLRGSITPSQAVSINEMGGEDFFEPSIAAKVKGWVQTNAMTPSVARDAVNELVTHRAAFLNTVRTARQNLEKLGVKESALEAGTGDIAFLIPRNIFDNELGDFAKELTFISRLIQDMGEALTGQVQRVELEQLSSSVPTVALLVDLGVLTAIGTVVNKFLDAWQKIERIRKVRGELTEMGLKGAAVEELSEQINQTVEQVVEESTEMVLADSKADEHRKRELGIAIRQHAHRLFGQIERGLTVEIRVQPKKDAPEDAQKMIGTISNLSKTMQFPQVAKEPMLLGTSEIIEGDIKSVKHTKKTTTKTTTTATRESSKEGRGDGKS